MSVLKVIEIMAQSEESWEDAARNAVKEVSKSVKNISSVYVREFKADVDQGNITNFIVDTKITFMVEDHNH